MRFFFFVLKGNLVFFFLNCVFLQSAFAEDLKVGIAGNPPFLFTLPAFNGPVFQIWETIAEANKLTYTLQYFNNIPEGMNALKTHAIDVLVGPVVITSGRLQDALFTQPFYTTDIAMAVHEANLSTWENYLPYIKKGVISLVSLTSFLVILFGVLIWLTERKKNPSDFQPNMKDGIMSGIWFSITTLTTVGYGDKVPHSHLGRFLTGIWMFISLIIVSSITAGLASTFTISGMPIINRLAAHSFSGKYIGTFAGIDKKNIVYLGGIPSEFSSLSDGIQALEEKKIHGFLFNKAELKYYLQTHSHTNIVLTDLSFPAENCGLAVSSLRPDIAHLIDIELLKMKESGVLRNILEKGGI